MAPVPGRLTSVGLAGRPRPAAALVARRSRLRRSAPRGSPDARRLSCRPPRARRGRQSSAEERRRAASRRLRLRRPGREPAGAIAPRVCSPMSCRARCSPTVATTSARRCTSCWCWPTCWRRCSRPASASCRSPCRLPAPSTACSASRRRWSIRTARSRCSTTPRSARRLGRACCWVPAPSHSATHWPRPAISACRSGPTACSSPTAARPARTTCRRTSTPTRSPSSSRLAGDACWSTVGSTSTRPGRAATCCAGRRRTTRSRSTASRNPRSGAAFGWGDAPGSAAAGGRSAATAPVWSAHTTGTRASVCATSAASTPCPSVGWRVLDRLVGHGRHVAVARYRLHPGLVWRTRRAHAFAAVDEHGQELLEPCGRSARSRSGARRASTPSASASSRRSTCSAWCTPSHRPSCLARG